EAAGKPFHELVNSDFNANEGCKAAKALCVNLYVAWNCRLTSILQKGHKRCWQDAGDGLGHPDLDGVHMPKGGVHDVNTLGGYLQYNEVRNAP
ncbi:hypothetical protein JB92DRAFT_2702709, partial [Gautieria morchelliformis]